MDYRDINQKIQDDKFLLANINDNLYSLSGFTYIHTNQDQYQVKRLPMGLKISPNAFSRAMTVGIGLNDHNKSFWKTETD